MSSVKIRLVKCPNCWNVLPESVDVPVYRCGGCGKILQAKYRQQQQQQEEEDGEKTPDMQGREDDVGDKASEEQDKNVDEEELNGVSEIAGDQNSHVSLFVEEEEIMLTNNDDSEQSEEAPSPPICFKRIMSGSTEYHDPCSTFSETCNSPPTTQTIRRYNYDASVSSLDDNSRWRRIRDKKGVFLGAANATSPYLSDEYHFRRYNKPASPEYIDEQNIKLLKIVYQLEEQLLKKTCSFQGGRGVNKHRLTSRSHELRNPHWNHHDMISSSYSSSSSTRIIPFSAVALPRNRKLHSEPLPSPPYNKSIHRTRTGRTSIINSYSSWPSSPVDELLSPQLDGFQKMEMQTSNLKKKKKQHLRPIARAAPFIACQNCSEFLLLPEDFLLFKGRCHRVRCGGCSLVMKFSLENGTYLVPYYQEDDDDLDFRAPPPSEADESSSMMMKMKMKMKSSSSTSRSGKMTYSRSTGAPLHNLMGYSTVSRVFKGYGPSSSSSMQNP